mmetsp:Transcript_17546/g.27327  ORF Transcript_17546/g.27327 Transcript_17546/m.27327 type:complete len:176 (+) Transcript_17546:84-611(+)
MKTKILHIINILFLGSVSAFVPANQRAFSHKPPCRRTPYLTDVRKESRFNNFRALPVENVSFLLAEEGGATIRQYIALALILGVLIDIVLGSPMANAVMKPMREASELAMDDVGTKGVNEESKSRERVDSEAIANEALQKARALQDLNKYLEENKTDKQRMEEMRQKIDRQLMDD